ncbi:hypothetical protein Hanom_Chr12g01090651 [Helianthus anomalus]
MRVKGRSEEFVMLLDLSRVLLFRYRFGFRNGFYKIYKHRMFNLVIGLVLQIVFIRFIRVCGVG